MPFAAKQSDIPQPDLFGVAEDPAPSRNADRDAALKQLNRFLATLRAARVWPWDEAYVDLRRSYVWPNLLRRLPEGEAAEWRMALEAEAARLDAA
jgi:hypothetical protein